MLFNFIEIEKYCLGYIHSIGYPTSVRSFGYHYCSPFVLFISIRTLDAILILILTQYDNDILITYHFQPSDRMLILKQCCSLLSPSTRFSFSISSHVRSIYLDDSEPHPWYSRYSNDRFLFLRVRLVNAPSFQHAEVEVVMVELHHVKTHYMTHIDMFRIVVCPSLVTN